MISVSTAVATEINKTSRMWNARLVKASDSSEIECDIKSVSVHKGACGEFSVGSIFVPYVELEVFGTPTINTEFILQLGVVINGTTEYINIGYFTPTYQQASTDITKITAQGRLSNMASEVLYSSGGTSKTLATLVSDVASKGYTITYKNGLTIPSASVSGDWTSLTCREALQIVATCVGGFVTEDNVGNICLCKFNPCTTADLSLDGERTTEAPEFTGEYEVTGCKVTVSETEEYAESTYNLEVTNPFFTSAMWNQYKANLTGLTFEVADADITLGDPRLEAWDCLCYTDNDNVTHMMPCFIIDYIFDGGLKMLIESKATLDNQAATTTGGPITQQLSSIKAAAEEAQATADAVASDLEENYDTSEEVDQKISEIEVESTYEIIEWARSSSSTTEPTSGWSTTLPTLTSTYKYLWQRVATVTESGTTYSTPQRAETMDGLYVFMNQAKDGSATVIDGGAIDTDTLYLGRIGSDSNNYAEVDSNGMTIYYGGNESTKIEDEWLYLGLQNSSGYTGVDFRDGTSKISNDRIDWSDERFVIESENPIYIGSEGDIHLNPTGTLYINDEPYSGGSGGSVPTGCIQMFGGPKAKIPSGWLLCNGAAVSRTTYASLYAVIGTLFGDGNGSTTFNLPDLVQRFPMGSDASDSTYSTGATGGSASTTLTTDNLPSHTHGLNSHTHSVGSHTHSMAHGHSDTFSLDNTKKMYCSVAPDVHKVAQGTSTSYQYMHVNGGSLGQNNVSLSGAVSNYSGNTGASGGTTGEASGSTASTGSGTSFTNRPPYVCVNFIIKT